METKSKMWVYGIVILVCIGISIFVTIKIMAKDYAKLIDEKEKPIQELQVKADEYEQKMQNYKKQAKYLAQEIVKSSDRIKAIQEDIKRKKEVVIVPPETTEETIRRLKEAGFDPKVECK